jgi:repressor LexA
MSRRHLTSKQHDFLQYLHGHVRERKVWPTYREIVDHFGYRSPNSVTQNLQALAKKGYLRRDHNGYHLVDRAADEGAITVRGALRGGGLAASEAPERLSLATLLPDLSGIQALRLDDEASRTGELGEARYVLLSGDEVPAGDTAVVLYNDAVALRRVGLDGRLEDPAGLAPPLLAAEARVLGRYAGHAGAYGLVRYAPMVVVEPPAVA